MTELEFKEALPSGCPPSDSVDSSLQSVIRFVEADDPSSISDDAFLSKAALGEERNGVDACIFSACSLFESERCKGFKSAVKWPKLRSKRIAELSIPLGSGRSKQSQSGHISFWSYANFEPLHHIIDVRDHGYA